MNDYQDLMNEYQEMKNKINEEYLNLSNADIRIKTFQVGVESFKENAILIPEKISKSYENLDKSTNIFANNLMNIKKYIDKEIIKPLNNLLENTKEISDQNLKIFNEIKISLIQERQKLNKTKDDYFKFLSNYSKQKFKNGDESLLFNAKKENFYQLYKYEINQMNTIIEQNNIKYNKMYNDLWKWREIQKLKIKNFFMKFSENVEKIGNLLIEFSKNILNDVNNEKEFDISSLDNEKSQIKNPRFEKVKLEEAIIEKKEKIQKNENENKLIENEGDAIIKYENNIITPMGVKSDNVVNDNFFDFDIIEKDELELSYIKSVVNKKSKKNKKDSKENSSKGINIIEEKNKILDIDETIAPSDLDITKNSSCGFNDFEIVEQNSLLFQKKYQLQNEQLIKDALNKIIGKEELLSQEISNLMNLLNEEDPKTKQLYSYTFLSKLFKLNDKYIVVLKNKKNFIHLSNILNDISIKQNNINILKIIIEISQIITYKEWYLYNLLQKKNKYLTTKTFWSNIIINSFINDLNKQSKIISKEQNNNEINKSKEKETSIYLLEFIQFSNQITNYKKLNPEQKRKLDKFARKNIKNILTKAIEGMCSFLVQKNIAIEVVNEFGKNFGFNNENMNYYELLIDVYMNRNYLYNLKKLSLDDKKSVNSAKICLISNVVKFLPKEKLLNLLIIRKDMSEDIKKNIFRNYLLNKMITIDERTRIWGLMLNIKNLKQKYNYEEKKQKLLKIIENKEIQKEEKTYQNFGIIDLDVKRTYFLNTKNSEKYQKILKNILKTIIYINKEIGYFQGMNYITAFFFQLFDFDEEKTFYFMLGIEKNTKFKEIFYNNLYLLSLFFSVFEKILKVNVPEIYQHQKNNEINPNYYLPPWFLTLFTFMCTKFEKENLPKFIILVLESFLLNGWSAIFNAGYTILKYLRNDIINLKADILMDYMVNKFGKEMLKEENYEIIRKEYIKNSYQINEELISKLLKITKYESNNK